MRKFSLVLSMVLLIALTLNFAVMDEEYTINAEIGLNDKSAQYQY